MAPDNYQQAWQAQASQTRVTVDADLLLKEVRRNQLAFRTTIFFRDFREIMIALIMIPVWFYLGAKNSLPWTWYLTVPALLWIIGFLLVDRMRHRQTPSAPNEPLLATVKTSLAQVEHQIWLLRHVFWWYLLPATISIDAFFAHVAIRLARSWPEAIGAFAFGTPLFLFLAAIYCFIDWVNQRAVRSQLGPRRQELLGLLASLGDESAGDVAATANELEDETPKVFRRWRIVAVVSIALFVVSLLASRLFDSSGDQPARSSGPGGDSLAQSVVRQREEKQLVGLAAMVMVDGQVDAAAAHGERKNGSGVPLEIGDRWHLGGITKSITATMIARLIESGRMQWSDTIGEAFPDDSVHQDWKPVTLRQLLTDTAGAPPGFSVEVLRQRPALGSESTQARRDAVLNVIAEKPAWPPGAKFAYSNVGYTIAGAMAERATGAAWEELVKREVFEPLALADAGFGPPKSADDSLEQPRGHRNFLAGKIPVDDQADNTFIMGPAGIVHMSLGDLCTYATEHLRGEQGEGKLLSAETYKLLHAPELDGYACGWLLKQPNNDIPHANYWHNGSNTLWYALVVFIPETKLVIAVASNDGDMVQAEAAAWEIVKASAKQ